MWTHPAYVCVKWMHTGTWLNQEMMGPSAQNHEGVSLKLLHLNAHPVGPPTYLEGDGEAG